LAYRSASSPAAFQRAGKGEAAERIATEIYDAIHDNVASKTDLREMEQRLDLRFEQLNVRFEQLDRRIDAMVMRLGGMIVIAIKYFG